MPPEPGLQAREAVPELLGYLNLSSGAPDARFQSGLNALFASCDSKGHSGTVHGGKAQDGRGNAWQQVQKLLLTQLQELRGTSSAFENTEQAEAVVRLALGDLLQEYRKFHRDLLFHQPDDKLFRPYFLARACEAVLQEGGPWDESQRIIQGALGRLNDFIGHRPVAVLENTQRMEPYPHEWTRPIPLYLQGAGVSYGPRWQLLEQTLEILRDTDEDLLNLAGFDLENLEELAVDPRAYDFEHPANGRINYMFGQWDPHRIDNRGNYRRFVVVEVTLDTLFSRVESGGEIPYEELLFEAAAVLAGTILMASGVSGSGPGVYDSETTLGTLLPRIAGYRDEFYVRLLEKVPGKHGKRLLNEAKVRRQPFAAARQHLNQRLARLRAAQQQHVCLARLLARMSASEASRRQVHVVPVASARMQCEIHCRLTTSHLFIDRGELTSAARNLREVEDLLHRAVECGALVDPWNILGFGGQFSLFPALENSIRDHRIDDLIQTVQQILDLCARLQSEAAAEGQQELQASVAGDMTRLADWWDQFGSAEFTELGGFSALEASQSAANVARALSSWHKAGAAAEDIAFWREHVEHFESPKAYALVVEALIQKGHLPAAMALLMQWLSQAEQMPLEDNTHSFHRMALRWANLAAHDEENPLPERWALVRRFCDYLEANADEYWQVPHFSWSGDSELAANVEIQDADEDDEENPFAAAYEGVTYQDSTADGMEGEVFDSGPLTDFELDEEATRLTRRLTFLNTVAEVWTVAAQVACEASRTGELCDPWLDRLRDWQQQARKNRQGLEELLDEVHRHRIPLPSGTHASLVEYDRRQMVKEFLLENGVKSCTATSSAAFALQSVVQGQAAGEGSSGWEQQALAVLQAVRQADAAGVRERLPELLDELVEQPLLYIPVTRNGEPGQIVQARIFQQLLSRLAVSLPRLGLLRETAYVMAAARQMEVDHPTGPGAVSEFDRLFRLGYQAMVECLVVSSETWTAAEEENRYGPLIESLNTLTECLLRLWLTHSSSLRLSVFETLLEPEPWDEIVAFIKEYGHDLFTPRFLNEGNLRAIMHQGAEAYLESLLEEPGDFHDVHLLQALEDGLPLEEAARKLQRIVLGILENYAEYEDYNHTTTQSDRGELLYCLLDFLRVRAAYERMAWKLRPVLLAHEILVRHNKLDAAEIWRRSIAGQTGAIAEEHLSRYEELVKQYGMRLPTVADRLAERFVRPLDVDRICALVQPSLEELRDGRPTRTFEVFEQEINDFAQTPTGVGLELPDWLMDLEDEIEKAQARSLPETRYREAWLPAWIPLEREDVDTQLEGWDDDEFEDEDQDEDDLYDEDDDEVEEEYDED